MNEDCQAAPRRHIALGLSLSSCYSLHRALLAHCYRSWAIGHTGLTVDGLPVETFPVAMLVRYYFISSPAANAMINMDPRYLYESNETCAPVLLGS